MVLSKNGYNRLDDGELTTFGVFQREFPMPCGGSVKDFAAVYQREKGFSPDESVIALLKIDGHGRVVGYNILPDQAYLSRMSDLLGIKKPAATPFTTSPGYCSW